MTETGTPASGETETPGYTSPFEEALQGLPFGLGSVFKGLTSGSGGGAGSFEFSLEEMTELHRQFKNEADLYRGMLLEAENAGRSLERLADDPASREHHKVAKQHFLGSLQPAIRQQLRFARGFEEAVGKAIGVRSSSEDAGADDAKKASKGL